MSPLTLNELEESVETPIPRLALAAVTGELGEPRLIRFPESILVQAAR